MNDSTLAPDCVLSPVCLVADLLVLTSSQPSCFCVVHMWLASYWLCMFFDSSSRHHVTCRGYCRNSDQHTAWG